MPLKKSNILFLKSIVDNLFDYFGGGRCFWRAFQNDTVSGTDGSNKRKAPAQCNFWKGKTVVTSPLYGPLTNASGA